MDKQSGAGRQEKTGGTRQGQASKPYRGGKQGQPSKSYGERKQGRPSEARGGDGERRQGRSSEAYGRDGQRQENKPYSRDGQRQENKSYSRDGQRSETKSYGEKKTGKPSESYSAKKWEKPFKSYGERSQGRPSETRVGDGDRRQGRTSETYGRDGQRQENKPYSRDGQRSETKSYGEKKTGKPSESYSAKKWEKPFRSYGERSQGRPSETRVGDGDRRQGRTSETYGRDGQRQENKPYSRDGQSQENKSYSRDGQRSETKSYGEKKTGKPSESYSAKKWEKPYGERSQGHPSDSDHRNKSSQSGKSFSENKHVKRQGRDEAWKSNRMNEKKKSSSKCPVFDRCGGCQLIDIPYEKQLEQKQAQLETLLKPFCHVYPIVGMENPNYYRNKVHAIFDHDRKGNPISGVYEVNTHEVVPVESCLIEDQKADEIIGTIRGMLKSFKIRTYDEDSGYGLLRHVLIRRGFTTGEIMVVLVTASPIFPSKNTFVKVLREKHPEITTIVQNINDRDTNMVLGDKEQIMYGKGYIEDILCGCRFRISPKSFYQINPVQTEVLYQKAIEIAGLTGTEKVVDAYCGIGTIGIVASKTAGEVIGVELNREAVYDAIENAKLNGRKNTRFFCNDAGAFMVDMADNKDHVDVVFMDPPRSGSTEEFMDSVAKMKPEKVIYISCDPMTLARDLAYFEKKEYQALGAWGVDMFPATYHVEAIILMTYCGDKPKK